MTQNATSRSRARAGLAVLGAFGALAGLVALASAFSGTDRPAGASVGTLAPSYPGSDANAAGSYDPADTSYRRAPRSAAGLPSAPPPETRSLSASQRSLVAACRDAEGAQLAYAQVGPHEGRFVCARGAAIERARFDGDAVVREAPVAGRAARNAPSMEARALAATPSHTLILGNAALGTWRTDAPTAFVAPRGIDHPSIDADFQHLAVAPGAVAIASAANLVVLDTRLQRRWKLGSQPYHEAMDNLLRFCPRPHDGPRDAARFHGIAGVALVDPHTAWVADHVADGIAMLRRSTPYGVETIENWLGIDTLAVSGTGTLFVVGKRAADDGCGDAERGTYARDAEGRWRCAGAALGRLQRGADGSVYAVDLATPGQERIARYPS